MRTVVGIFTAVALAGCASTAPADLQAPLENLAAPYGVVTKVEKNVYQGPRNQGGMAGVAAFGIVGALIGGAIADASARETRFVHEISPPTGEPFTEFSKYEFPVGTCVSLGGNGAGYEGRLARSTRCKPQS